MWPRRVGRSIATGMCVCDLLWPVSDSLVEKRDSRDRAWFKPTTRPTLTEVTYCDILLCMLALKSDNTAWCIWCHWYSLQCSFGYPCTLFDRAWTRRLTCFTPDIGTFWIRLRSTFKKRRPSPGCTRHVRGWYLVMKTKDDMSLVQYTTYAH
jgi:hypothetical protein